MKIRNIILVTDGDRAAQRAVEIATTNIGGRCISASGGNPTILTGGEIIELIKKADHDPVVVMVDDRGVKGMGNGEKAMDTILQSNDVNVLGIVAVSSNGMDCNGINVTESVTKEGTLIKDAVDKYGNDTKRKDICGDTLSILRGKKDILIVGIGDPGKMDFNDEAEKGAPITTKALKEIMQQSH